jgi:hypothetical protein
MQTKRANTRHISAMLQLATAADIHEGKEWYDRAYKYALRLIHTYPITMGQAVGVIAALSPNNKWERNCQDADRLIDTFIQGGDLSLCKVCTYGKNKQKALDILSLESADAEAIEGILSGQKITAFYRSIMGHDDAVCVDGHAYSVFMGQRIPTSRTPKISPTLYDAIVRSYKLVADRSVDLCGESLTPVQVQAITWVTFRRRIKE